MFSITIRVPSAVWGPLNVTARVEPGHYEIERVESPGGTSIHCSLDLLDEIETSIEYELQCAWYQECFYNCEDPALIALYS